MNRRPIISSGPAKIIVVTYFATHIENFYKIKDVMHGRIPGIPRLKRQARGQEKVKEGGVGVRPI